MLTDIITKPFVLFANCTVKYSGRAESLLPVGNYLIIYKKDGSIIIHANNKVPPRNYQGKKTVLDVKDNTIIATNGNETLEIIVWRILSVIDPVDWGDEKLQLKKTERELCNILINNTVQYFGKDFNFKQTEYATEAGPIDIVLADKPLVDNPSEIVIVEVKRHVVDINTISQLQKYQVALLEQGLIASCYVAAPTIRKSAIKQCVKIGYKYCKVDFT